MECYPDRKITSGLWPKIGIFSQIICAVLMHVCMYMNACTYIILFGKIENFLVLFMHIFVWQTWKILVLFMHIFVWQTWKILMLFMHIFVWQNWKFFSAVYAYCWFGQNENFLHSNLLFFCYFRR
jgi:hypothetical protein